MSSTIHLNNFYLVPVHFREVVILLFLRLATNLCFWTFIIQQGVLETPPRLMSLSSKNNIDPPFTHTEIALF